MPHDPYADALNTALNAAPDLVYSPSLAMAAASDPQPDLAAQAVAFAQQQNALQTAASNQLAAAQQQAPLAAQKGASGVSGGVRGLHARPGWSRP
jgi:hypothetical protein